MNTGANLSGWQIGLYTDSDCTNAVAGSPFVTGADGTVTVSGLQKGTYYAKEIPTDDAHTGTASAGDTIDYQIISTLPSITSESTFLSCYTFVDTLSKGMTYNKGDVVLEFFTDAACTDSVAKWTEADGNE